MLRHLRLLSGLFFLLAAIPRAAAGQAAVSAQPPDDLDAFMARVLERRDENWKKLHDYILSEAEQFSVLASAGLPLHGMRREFMWYVRDGYLVRSPVTFDGVEIGEKDRREYEEKWLREERDREARRVQQEAKKAAGEEPSESRRPPHAGRDPNRGADDQAIDGFVDERGEPRFVSEAYFLRFKFEPGNYFLAGRETLEGREVVRIEYYPTRLFEDEHGEVRASPGGVEVERRQGGQNRPPRKGRSEVDNQEVERKLNKVSLVTLWVDPAEYQIVRYTFDNVGFDFLPGRWLVRVDDVTASMTMARVFEDVWLPKDLTMKVQISLASGPLHFEYGRRFYDHKKAQTSARIRGGAGQ